MCDQAKAKDKVMFAISGLVSGTQILTVVAPFVYGPNPNWNAQRAAGKTTFASSPGWRRAMQAWISMNRRGCFQTGASGYSLGASQALVAQGEAVSWLGVSNVIGAIQPLNPSMPIGVFPVPGPKPRHIVGYGNAVGVNKASPNLETALDFVKFMGSKGQAKVYPGLIGNMTVPQFSAAFKTGKILQKGKPWARYRGWGPLIKADKTVQIVNLPWPNGQVYADLTTGAAGLLAGSASVNDVLSRMDRSYGP
jgi:raffinose/stachyose/melibiose transport system substrate-binding protein